MALTCAIPPLSSTLLDIMRFRRETVMRCIVHAGFHRVGTLSTRVKAFIAFSAFKRAVFVSVQVPVDRTAIETFCQKWKVREFSIFGSAIRGDFRQESDIDVLVAFDDAAGWSLFDLVDMREELQAIFGREVDLVEKKALRNPFRRHHILTNREVVYAR